MAAQRASFTAVGDSRSMRWPIRWATLEAVGKRPAGEPAVVAPAGTGASMSFSVSSRNIGLPPVCRASAGASRPGSSEATPSESISAPTCSAASGCST